MNGRGNRQQSPLRAVEGACARLRRRVLAAVAAAVLMAGAGSAKPVSRAIPEQISRAIPRQVAVDGLYETPYGTILRGHAEDFDGVADLLENLDRIPGFEEPVLRHATRSERGYEYTLVVPKPVPAPDEASLWRGDSGWREPFFVTLPVAMSLDRLLFPPFIRPLPVRRHRRSGGAGAEKGPGNQDQPAADEQAFAGLSIDEITVQAIYQTSIGGVVQARARGREILLREGDRLADGEVDESPYRPGPRPRPHSGRVSLAPRSSRGEHAPPLVLRPEEDPGTSPGQHRSSRSGLGAPHCPQSSLSRSRRLHYGETLAREQVYRGRWDGQWMRGLQSRQGCQPLGNREATLPNS